MSSPLSMVGVLVSLPVHPAAALAPPLVSSDVKQTPCGTNRKAHVTPHGSHPRWRPGVISDMGGASVMMWQQDGRGYCFEGVARATEAAVASIEQQGGRGVGSRRDEHRAGACAGVAFLTPGVADELTDCAQWRQVLPPALSSVLLVLDRVPGEENEDKADKLETGGQAKVDKAE